MCVSVCEGVICEGVSVILCANICDHHVRV